MRSSVAACSATPSLFFSAIGRLNQSFEELPLGLVQAGSYPTYRAALERSLVPLAMGIPCWIGDADDGSSVLLVEPERLGGISEELARFERERVGWPPVPRPIPRRPRTPGERLTPLLWALSVIAVFWEQTLHPGRLEAWGALDGNAVIRRGELWRPFTALWLHADASHLLSNLGAGIFAFAAVLPVCGVLRGWLLTFAAAFAANLAMAAVHASAGDISLGASTAIFAAIGVLAGRASARAAADPAFRTWRSLLLPFAAGLILLGLYGSGDGSTDVAAHAAGFICGLGAGFVRFARAAG